MTKIIYLFAISFMSQITLAKLFPCKKLKTFQTQKASDVIKNCGNPAQKISIQLPSAQQISLKQAKVNYLNQEQWLYYFGDKEKLWMILFRNEKISSISEIKSKGIILKDKASCSEKKLNALTTEPMVLIQEICGKPLKQTLDSESQVLLQSSMKTKTYVSLQKVIWEYPNNLRLLFQNGRLKKILAKGKK